MLLEPSKQELQTRRTHLLDTLRDWEPAGVCLFAPLRIFYLTGFAFIPTERPLALILTSGGETALFVPRLEKEHAERFADVDRVADYPEYPGETHPMQHLRHLLESLDLARGSLAVDGDGYGGGFGYRGPALSDLLPHVQIVKVDDVIDAQMAVKSPEEIALLRESARWGHRAHELLQQYTRAGATEIKISARASQEATAQMLEALGPAYRAHGWMAAGAHAGFRGQIGPHSAVPHALITNATIRPGDVLVTGATASMAGYYSELERTMIMTPISKDAERLFALMVAAQETALESLQPGGRCADVDRAVRGFYETHDLMPYWRHHTGHTIGIGIPNHAAPFLDTGDATEIVPGWCSASNRGSTYLGVEDFVIPIPCWLRRTAPNF